MSIQDVRHAAITNVLDEFRPLLSDTVPTLAPVDITETKSEWNQRCGIYLLSDENGDSFVWRYVGLTISSFYNRLYVAGEGENEQGEWVNKYTYKWIDVIPFDREYVVLGCSLEALLIVRLQPTENKEYKKWTLPPIPAS